MLLVYEGPPDSYDPEVAAAIAAAREHATIELPDEREGAGEGATITATDVAPQAASGYLEPGRVYDLPTRLAEARLETSAWWSHVERIADLSDEQLRSLAHERNVPGRSKLKGKELARAVSAASPATLPDPAPDASAPAGGDTSPPADATAAGATAAPATTTTTTPGVTT